MTEQPTTQPPEADEDSLSVDQSEPRYSAHRRRILASTAVLPALFTIGNGLAGLASIHYATKDPISAANLGNIELAAWLLAVAMGFDMLDGRVARLTRRTSEFGGQLDSLCDMVSFGVAPAMLMMRTVMMALHGHIDRMADLHVSVGIVRILWCVGGVYFACAALRLARYNVESEPEESSHMSFRGLPTPAAAGAVGAMVLLFTYLAAMEEGWQSSTWLLMTVSITVPIVTLLAGLMMVSRIRYPHVVNQYLRSKKPFSFLVKVVLLIVAAISNPYITAAVVAVLYVGSGPVTELWNRFKQRKQTA